MPILLFFVGFGCQKQQKTTNEVASIGTTPSAKEPMADNCSLCGMATQDHPKWRVQAFFGKRSQSFCSPKCLFLYQHNQHIAADSAWAMDYYDVKLFNATEGFFVTGSDVLGPMGHDFVPFSGAEAAQEFAQDHAGKQIVPFGKVDSLVIFGL